VENDTLRHGCYKHDDSNEISLERARTNKEVSCAFGGLIVRDVRQEQSKKLRLQECETVLQDFQECSTHIRATI
jgi:hypothetical protein